MLLPPKQYSPDQSRKKKVIQMRSRIVLACALQPQMRVSTLWSMLTGLGWTLWGGWGVLLGVSSKLVLEAEVCFAQ
eukprot:13795669-Ditylum_brightwellii.AAC.1